MTSNEQSQVRLKPAIYVLHDGSRPLKWVAKAGRLKAGQTRGDAVIGESRPNVLGDVLLRGLAAAVLMGRWRRFT